MTTTPGSEIHGTETADTHLVGGGLHVPAKTDIVGPKSRAEEGFEAFLWASRYVVIVAVLASVAIGFAMFYVATVDTVGHLRHIGEYTSRMANADQHEEDRSQTIAHVVEAIDGYLLGTVMLIFAFGLYELFISRIDAAEVNHHASRLLSIHSLDDLKGRLGQVVLLILIVKFFENALRIKNYKTVTELVYLAFAILLIAGSLFLAHKKAHPQSDS